jgi:hypothetical protein
VRLHLRPRAAARRVDVAHRPPDADADTLVIFASPDFFDALRNV